MRVQPINVRRILGIGFGFVMAACSGDGCGCTESTPGGFPSAERTENAVQVRVTPTGLAAVEADPAALVGSFLGTEGGAFPLPATCGGNPEICCDNGQPVEPCGPVNLDFVPQGGDEPRLEINPVNGNGHVQVITRMRIKTGAPIPVRTQGQNCEINIDTEDSGNDSVEIALDLDLEVDPGSGTTMLANVVASVNDLNNGDIDIDGNLICEAADTFLKGTIRGQLEDALEGILAEQIANLSCKQCPSGDVADCGEFGDACTDGVCQRGGGCLQELGIAGRVIAERAFSDLSSGQLGKMDIYQVAGGYSENTAGGISLGVTAGAIPASTPRDRCGPSAQQPAFTATVPRSNFFSGNTRPDTGNAFGVGIGLHKYNLDLFSWSSYESGLLCLNVGPTAVDLLTAETFAIVMPSLLALAHNEPAPVTLGLRPQGPPILTLGAGTTTPAGDIDDPLILVQMPGLEIDLFSMIDEHWIRVMTLKADVTLPINLEADDMGSLTPTLGADGAFENLVVTNSEALEESPEELAAQFPTLLNLALPMLAGGLAIDLPLLGSLELQVQPDGITSIEGNTILAIFADLAVVEPSERSQLRAQTTARIADVQLPPAAAFAAPHLHQEQRPVITLELGGHAASEADLEWSVRINGGLWSPYSRHKTRAVESPLLWLEGNHEIEVRSREVGQGHTTDATPVSLTLPIDHLGPTLKKRVFLDDILLVSARDYVDESGMTLEYKIDGGTWQTIERVPAGAVIAIDLDGTSAELAEVRAVDSSGNVSGQTLGASDLIGFHGSGDAGGCECDASGSAALGGWLPALACLLLVALFRRRESARVVLARLAKFGALALVAGASLVLQACSCGSGAECEGQDCDDVVKRGPTGRWLSSAESGERTVLAAYDQNLGDLVLIDVSDSGELSYTALDGVPDDVPATFDPDSYRGGISPDGPDVGAWTSVALEGSDVRVSYQSLDTRQLLFGREGGGEFNANVVDGNDGENAGLFSSLAIRGGVPTIAYAVVGASGDGGVKLSQLRMAVASSESPSGASDWEISVVDETPISCAGLCEAGLSCVTADAEIGPACTAPTADCAEPCGEDDACVGGVCLSVQAAPTVADLPLGTGLYANNLTLADGRAAIVFYRRHTGDLVIAVEDAGAFTVVALDAAVATDTGANAAAVLGPDGAVHIAYQDAVSDRVLYLATDGATVLAGPEVVDDGARDGDVRSHPVGGGLSIAARGSELIIAYQDGLTSDVVVSRGTPGAWTRSALTSGPTLDGFYNQILGGHVATFSYDRALSVPGDVLVTPLP